jgi:hypothetical protein
MGDIAFGKSFEMIQNGKPHFALDLLREGMKPLGVLGPIPWAFCILTRVPGLGAGFKTFVSWCAEQVEKRKKVRFQPSRQHDYTDTCPDQIEMEVPDVMSWLIESCEKSEKGRREAEQAILQCDSRLIIVAGR